MGASGPAGDPAALHRLADALDGHAGSVGDLGADAIQTTAAVRNRAEWTGSAADGYAAFSSGAGSGIAGAQGPLSRIASSVRNYADALQAAQRQAAVAQQSANAANAASASGVGHAAHAVK